MISLPIVAGFNLMLPFQVRIDGWLAFWLNSFSDALVFAADDLTRRARGLRCNRQRCVCPLVSF